MCQSKACHVQWDACSSPSMQCMPDWMSSPVHALLLLQVRATVGGYSVLFAMFLAGEGGQGSCGQCTLEHCAVCA